MNDWTLRICGRIAPQLAIHECSVECFGAEPYDPALPWAQRVEQARVRIAAEVERRAFFTAQKRAIRGVIVERASTRST